MAKRLKAIPTNIITGFLGVGKTSSILHLLSQKPENETWAVLVNEFGTMGIDASILANQGAFIAQVPGGCICCVQGLPFEVALNRLIKLAKPHRLIIEPSGLAHPYGIIKQLSEGYFKALLSLQATICLVDARHFSDRRYTSNAMFVDQIALADVLLANKTDLASEKSSQQFSEWTDRIKPKKSVVSEISQGEFSLDYLNLERNLSRKPARPDSHSTHSSPSQIASWCSVYSSAVTFELEPLLGYFRALDILRLKAILNTNVGWYVFNQVDDELTYYETNRRAESQIEVLGRTEPLTLEKYKMNCND